MTQNLSSESKQRMGVQTKMWGKRLTPASLEAVLRDIAEVMEASKENPVGVEFAQNPYHLGYDTHKEVAEKLNELLEKNHLVLLGLSGIGSLRNSVKLSRYLTKKPKYFTVQRWYNNYDTYDSETLAEIVEMGSHLAIHPLRFGMNEKLEDISDTLSQKTNIFQDTKYADRFKPYPLKFILDTAHIWLAKNNFEDVLKNQLVRDRLIAVSLKDWKKTYDSSLRYYSRGFTELGQGFISSHRHRQKVNPKDSDLGLFRDLVNKIVKELNSEIWFVFEQEQTVHCPKDSLWASYEWWKTLDDRKASCVLKNSFYRSTSVREIVYEKRDICELEQEYETKKRSFIEKLHIATPSSKEEFAALLLRLFRDFFMKDQNGSDLSMDCVFWEISPRVACMQRIATAAEKFSHNQRIWHDIDWDDCNSLRLWDLNTNLSPQRGQKNSADYPKYLDHYDDEWLKKKIDNSADTILSFPICNSYNYSQIEARVDIFLNYAKSNYLRQSEDIARPKMETIVRQKVTSNEEVKDFEKGVKNVLERQLELTLDDIIQQVAVALERLWGNLAYQAANDFMDNMHHSTTTRELLNQFGEWLKTTLNCDVFTPYRVLELEDDTYLDPFEDIMSRIAPNKEDDICSRAWKYQDFGFKRPECDGITEFAFPFYDPTKSCSGWIVPNITHVVKCRFNTNEPQRLLTSSDENIVRELLHAFLPVFSNRLAAERREASLGIIVHETKHSLNNLHGVLCRINSEIQNSHITLTRDYVGEAFDYWDLMVHTINTTDFLRTGKINNCDRTPRVELVKDIIWPVIHQSGVQQNVRQPPEIDILYDNKRLSTSMRYNELPPELNIDKMRMIQVFSNLLNNSIKYYDKDHLKIEVQIERSRETSGLKIIFRDWGPGIPEQFSEFIFEEGFRSPNVLVKIPGDGIGLWLSRQIVEAHGGTLKLTKCSEPTEFTIELPDCFYKFSSSTYK